MASHIVSWGGGVRCASPALSVLSIASFESSLTDTHLTSSSALDALRAKHPALDDLKLPADERDGFEEPFERHDKWFFKDGNITFLVDGMLYCVHRYFFSRDSEYFANRFDQLGIREHEALSTVISLSDVERKDFDAFLSVIYPDDFDERALAFEQWKSVLRLATRWGFASLRKLAIKSIAPPTPHDRLLLGRAYDVDPWVLPALSALCAREVPLSLREARQMRVEDIVLVATVREDIRKPTLQVDPAEIPHCVQAALDGMRALEAGSGAFARPDAESSAAASESGGSAEADPLVAPAAATTNAEKEGDDDAATMSPVDTRQVAGSDSDEKARVASPAGSNEGEEWQSANASQREEAEEQPRSASARAMPQGTRATMMAMVLGKEQRARMKTRQTQIEALRRALAAKERQLEEDTTDQEPPVVARTVPIPRAKGQPAADAAENRVSFASSSGTLVAQNEEAPQARAPRLPATYYDEDELDRDSGWRW